MNHKTARLLIGADPHGLPAALAVHLDGCPECSRFQREMGDLDDDIQRAMRGPRPLWGRLDDTRSALHPVAAHSRAGHATPWPRWAMAASVMLVTLGAFWAFRPGESLAHEVAQHVRLESGSWTATQDVTPLKIQQTLAAAGVELDTRSAQVMYARNCPFRGHMVPHLVVSTPMGRATVLILPYDSVQHRVDLHEEGLSGVLMPAPRGSIAVLMQAEANIDTVSRELRQAVHWLP